MLFVIFRYFRCSHISVWKFTSGRWDRKSYAEDANPKVTEYKWFKGTSSNLTALSYSQTLFFKTVEIQDSGQYTCNATNAAGTSTDTIQVIVQCKSLRSIYLILEIEI